MEKCENCSCCDYADNTNECHFLVKIQELEKEIKRLKKTTCPKIKTCKITPHNCACDMKDEHHC